MKFCWLILLSFFVLANCCAAEPRRPNVLVVMVDDLGFSDIGCYGGEIETPNLDRLAADGLRFSQFYNTAKCHSSRISLLTGCYAMQAGNVSLSRAVTSAEVLSEAGYFTAMTGKWHLDREPTDFGFRRYFGHLSGACNYFLGDHTFRLNGRPWKVPSEGFYTTVADVDYAIEFLGEARKSDQPWYLYVAFNAPHAPLQALEQDYRKYEGRYDAGWDTIRDARVAKQKALGLFDEKLIASERPKHIPAWDSLSKERQVWESKRMTTLAAMIDRVDQEIGRLVDDVVGAGELENTLILFVSDNGACPYDRRSSHVDAEPTNGSVRWGDSTGWAWARNGPFRYYKQNQFEGGIASPAIVHWPAGLKTEPGQVTSQPAHLIDVLPTLAEVCQAKIPEKFAGRDLQSISGVSLAPILAANTLPKRPPIHLLFASDRGLRDGDWKIVSFRSQPWELYNLAKDRTERHDLASQHPERVARMVRVWTELTLDVLKASPQNAAPVSEVASPHVHPEWTDFSVPPKDGLGKRTTSRASRSKRKPGSRPRSTIRARKDTKMTLDGGQIRLLSTGQDSGIAMDRIADVPAGPYRLTFRLKSDSKGEGDVFFTIDPRVTLPKGQRLPFEVNHDGFWHDYELTLDTKATIHALRLDVGGASGNAVIENLTLRTSDGAVIARWPAEQE